MELPVKNIVDDIDLKGNDVLLPLFESVVNSIISLKQTDNISVKKIQIQIERGDPPKNINLFDNQNTIKSIKIIDNGEGFTTENLKSFKTAFSQKNKKEFGCKGIGRFTMLASFEKVEVESNYLENNIWNKIEFEFDPINEVKISSQEKSSIQENKTIVYLKNLYHEILKEASALSINQIAEELMTHLLIYYLCDDLPRIEILDLESGDGTVVNEKYEYLTKEREREFTLGKYDFKSYITKTEKTNNRKNHYVYYCANSRVVGGGKSLSKINSLFMYPISNNGTSFLLDVYLVSDYLNKTVYSSRNGFSIPHEKEKGIFDENNIAYEDINNRLTEILSDEYSSFVRETQERNNKEIVEYISTDAPRYKRFSKRPEILNSIPPNLTDEKKEEFLHKIAYREQKRIEKNIQDFIQNKKVSEETIQAVKKELKEKTASDVDSLADYMFRRKAIIDIFKKFLEADANGTYKLEEDIHNLIFPMGLTQKEVDYDSHNLWILDERFATYSFIASDVPITSVSQKKSSKEPDLLLMKEDPQMFDNPISFASSPSGELQSMVIFEFKRPGETAWNKRKKDYRWEFSELVEKYFDEFLYGHDKKNFKGRPVVVQKSTPKYGFVIVDVIPPQLKEYNKGKGYRQTPFGTMYKIYPDLNMHIEVITFEQLMRAVETRHAPFFDKLFS